jgi:predicted Zn-dependent protease
VLVVEVDQETIQVVVALVVLVVVVMAQPIQDREEQELPTLAEVAVEVLSLQQELLVDQVSSSLLTQPHK